MLNPTLYGLLVDRFREVNVANEGEALSGEYKHDPRSDRVVLDVAAWGETYCVDCPYCFESRHRLWINHRYGTFDDVTNSNNSHMVRCFNEECVQRDSTLFKDLYDKVFGMMNISERRSISYLRGNKAVTNALELKPCDTPGEVVSLLDLPSNHPAIVYLDIRGYDSKLLAQRYNLMYCDNALHKYPLAHRRIIIPIVQNSMYVGWQARFTGDLNWRLAGIPKTYSCPGMPKRIMLYNHDVAFNQSFIVVTEGPTSCWSVWPYGVAILGKQATMQQQRMLAKQSETKPIVLLLDGDAAYESEKLYNSLKPYAKAGLLKVTLPKDKDPGDYARHTDELWDLIFDQADKANIRLEGINI